MKSSVAAVVWSMIYLLLLLSLLTPLRVLTPFFLIVPGAVLFASQPFRTFAMCIIPVALILAIVNPLFLLPMAYFLIPALIMGRAYKKSVPAFHTLMIGTGVIIAEFLLLLLLATTFFHFDLSHYIRQIVTEMVAPLQDMANNNPLTQVPWDDSATQNIADVTVLMIPYALIVTSFTMAVITHALVRPILSSMGMAVPKMKPAREWRLPRALIWYYLLAIIIEWIANGSGGGWATTIAANLIPLINICFVIQTIGFFFFLVHARKWSPVLSFVFAGIVLLIHPLRIIGIIDLAFPLREAITRSKR
ncbi:YybS family protein [Paenibacillus sp. P96]|uniref:YybS family protein n=1 Tax=Paenibacillus zeirhizosphaerae TaxID=2987519 RepID=A0ABT9FNX9_9BACL|nr:DUF2232 domain-containing protein [Paenibacillus sp. P96]MDP4096434.1 YybS family protein [Paenibacillus sp. P96]